MIEDGKILEVVDSGTSHDLLVHCSALPLLLLPGHQCNHLLLCNEIRASESIVDAVDETVIGVFDKSKSEENLVGSFLDHFRFILDLLMFTVEEPFEEWLRDTPLLPQHLLRLVTVVGTDQTCLLLHDVRDFQRLHLFHITFVSKEACDVHLLAARELGPHLADGEVLVDVVGVPRLSVIKI